MRTRSVLAAFAASALAVSGLATALAAASVAAAHASDAHPMAKPKHHHPTTVTTLKKTGSFTAPISGGYPAYPYLVANDGTLIFTNYGAVYHGKVVAPTNMDPELADINDHDLAGGYSVDSGTGVAQAIVWKVGVSTAGTVLDLSALSPAYSQVLAVDDKNEIVGVYEDADSHFQGFFMRTPTSTPIALEKGGKPAEIVAITHKWDIIRTVGNNSTLWRQNRLTGKYFNLSKATHDAYLEGGPRSLAANGSVLMTHTASARPAARSVSSNRGSFVFTVKGKTIKVPYANYLSDKGTASGSSYNNKDVATAYLYAADGKATNLTKPSKVHLTLPVLSHSGTFFGYRMTGNPPTGSPQPYTVYGLKTIKK
jgi:hypothetical protein